MQGITSIVILLPSSLCRVGTGPGCRPAGPATTTGSCYSVERSLYRHYRSTSSSAVSSTAACAAACRASQGCNTFSHSQAATGQDNCLTSSLRPQDIAVNSDLVQDQVGEMVVLWL